MLLEVVKNDQLTTNSKKIADPRRKFRQIRKVFIYMELWVWGTRGSAVIVNILQITL